jgi:hypothetical protein
MEQNAFPVMPLQHSNSLNLTNVLILVVTCTLPIQNLIVKNATMRQTAKLALTQLNLPAPNA